jgi:glycine dehydrogenase subunit 1
VIARTIHPYYREVVRTYCQGLGLSLIEAGYVDGRVSPDEIRKSLTDNSAGLLLQYPNFFGIIEEIPELIEMARKKGIRVAVSVDPVALGVLRSPAEFGADIVVGEGQGMGNAMSFGGPYVGFFATRSEFIRQMPGRIVGVTHDRKGRKGYTLTLQTREQHIKRERATSNICTNESLNALASLFYMAALGKKGLAEVAAQSARKAHYLRTELGKLRNVSIPWTGSFFKEFTVRVSEAPESVNRRLIAEKIIGGLDLGKFYPELRGNMLFCVTEKRTRSEIDKLVSVISAGPNGKS